MTKLAAFCTRGNIFVAITENNNVSSDIIGSGRPLEKVYPGYLPGDELDAVSKFSPLRSRHEKYGSPSRLELKRHQTQPKKHQRDISRRDHGNHKCLVAEMNEWIERQEQLFEEYMELFDRLYEPFTDNEDESDFDIILCLNADVVEERQAA